MVGHVVRGLPLARLLTAPLVKSFSSPSKRNAWRGRSALAFMLHPSDIGLRLPARFGENEREIALNRKNALFAGITRAPRTEPPPASLIETCVYVARTCRSRRIVGKNDRLGTICPLLPLSTADDRAMNCRKVLG